MSRARPVCSTASHTDAACSHVTAPIVKFRLPATIPLLPEEVRTLDQLLGAEIARLFQEE
jgi:hypothetical protein